jgi:hypothetical protein
MGKLDIDADGRLRLDNYEDGDTFYYDESRDLLVFGDGGEGLDHGFDRDTWAAMVRFAESALAKRSSG